MALTLLVMAAQAQTPQETFWDASKVGDTVAMAKALDRGAKLQAIDTRRSRNGRAALNYAAWFDHPAAIGWLLRAGADIEAVNYTGFTALHHAAENGSLAAARILLDAGADPDHANERGWLPIDTARDRGHMKVAELLEAAEKGED